MFKKLSILLVFCLSCKALYSQSLMQSVGATISLMSAKASNPNVEQHFSLTQINLIYFPRYNFIENNNSSVSIGAPVGVGIGLASNDNGNDAGLAFSYDLPIVLDYNIGCKSTKDNDENIGGYFGIGFGYYRVSISQTRYLNFNGENYGPILRGGIRVRSASENWNGHGLSIGLFYKKGLEKVRISTFGLNILYDL